MRFPLRIPLTDGPGEPRYPGWPLKCPLTRTPLVGGAHYVAISRSADPYLLGG